MPAFLVLLFPNAVPMRRQADPQRSSPLPWLTAQLFVLVLGLILLGHERSLVNLLLAPMLEETLLRLGLQDAVQRALRQSERGRAFNPRIVDVLPPLACALVFAAAHTVLRPDALSAATFFPALLIGFIYQRHNTLTSCVVLHALFNLLWFSMELRLI